jgi:hypothetical protein
MISEEDKKEVEVARKYGIRPGTVKCQAFRLFDEGYKPMEVRYLLRRSANTRHRRGFSHTIRRYY